MMMHGLANPKNLPEDEPSSSKRVEDIKIKNQNINLGNVHFVDLYCIITLQLIRWIFRNYDAGLWTGSSWLRIKTVSGHL
jgi:hypothetical protein